MRRPQWQLQDAKTQFSQAVEAPLQGEPQHITRKGREAVVVLSDTNYHALREGACVYAPGFVAHLLAIPKVGESRAESSRIALRDAEV